MLDSVSPSFQIGIQELNNSQGKTYLYFSPTFTIFYVSTLIFVYFFLQLLLIAPSFEGNKILESLTEYFASRITQRGYQE